MSRWIDQNRWIEKEDGWHKNDDPSVEDVSNRDHFYRRPIPPVRDANTGYPIGPNGDIDWARVIEEANKKDNQ